MRIDAIGEEFNSKQKRALDAPAPRRLKTRAGNAKSAPKITPRRHFTDSACL